MRKYESLQVRIAEPEDLGRLLSAKAQENWRFESMVYMNNVSALVVFSQKIRKERKQDEKVEEKGEIGSKTIQRTAS